MERVKVRYTKKGNECKHNDESDGKNGDTEG